MRSSLRLNQKQKSKAVSQPWFIFHVALVIAQVLVIVWTVRNSSSDAPTVSVADNTQEVITETDKTTIYGEIGSSTFVNTKKAAWVTLVHGPNYIRGALLLAYSLKRVETKYDRILIMTRETGKQYAPLLEKHFTKIIWIDKDSLTDKIDVELSDKETGFFIKMHVWKITGYDVVAFIGADCIVTRNIDQVMLCPPPCGVFDTWTWETTYLGPTMNGDFFVIEPSEEDFEGMIQLAKEIPKSSFQFMRDIDNSQVGPFDQALINAYYGWRLTIVSPILAGIEVIPTHFTQWRYQPERYNYSLYHFAQMHFRPWNVEDVDEVLQFEKAWFKDKSFVVAKRIENDYYKDVDEEEKQAFLDLPPKRQTKYHCHASREKCEEIKTIQESGDPGYLKSDKWALEQDREIARYNKGKQTAQYNRLTDKQKKFAEYLFQQRMKKYDSIIEDYDKKLEIVNQKLGKTS